MWEQIKVTIKRWFSSDTEEEYNNKRSTQQQPASQEHKTIQARTSYLYPNDRSTKFPVEPIRLTRKKREPQPIFNEEKPKVDSKVNNNRDDYKFSASRVASPIYGFNRPTQSENLEIPAYLRKKKENSLVENKETGNKSIQSSYVAEHNKDVTIAEKREIKEKTEDTVNKIKQNPIPTNILDYAKSKEKPELPQKNVSELRKNEANDEPYETPLKPVKKTDGVFNVIMTPKDKKLHMEDQPNKSVGTPPLHLLNDPREETENDKEWVEQQKELLESTLKHFHIRASVVDVVSGPSVTRFEIQPKPGVKVSKIKNLSDDIKLNMAARDIRMEAPIPGKNTIGIEVPNPVSQSVVLQDVFKSDAFMNDTSPLTVALGLDISGNPIVTNLNKMPHGLIAGATGSGKSVCINTILISLLYRASYKDVRFLLIDPKMVELAPYNEMPHLVSPVITDVKAATKALKWAVAEMEERYEKFVEEGCRDIERYNQKLLAQNREEEKLPYLVIVIDELADLMMVSPQDVEDSICRIAQKARAAGIHLLLATQRPSVDVITGLIKSNIPTRIAFSVSSQVDSRTIIDISGAEKLLGRGDMLFQENGARQLKRIQGAFVSDEEIERVTSFIKKFEPPHYLFEQEQLIQQIHTEEEQDDLFQEAVEFVVSHKGASASLLQRRFKIGYNRAARLIDTMEEKGIISEQNGSKPREVLVSEVDVTNQMEHHDKLNDRRS